MHTVKGTAFGQAQGFRRGKKFLRGAPRDAPIRSSLLQYNGWQRASNTTPEALFASVAADSSKQPFWAKYLEQPTGSPGTDESEKNSLAVPRTPEESRNLLISHVLDYFPSASPETLKKLI